MLEEIETAGLLEVAELCLLTQGEEGAGFCWTLLGAVVGRAQAPRMVVAGLRPQKGLQNTNIFSKQYKVGMPEGDGYGLEKHLCKLNLPPRI